MNNTNIQKTMMAYLHGQTAGDSDAMKVIQTFRKDDVSKPFIYVGAGTCGLGAGAAETINAIKEQLKQNTLDAEIVEVGCIGLCTAEPIVDVQLPGRNRVSFRNVTHDKTGIVIRCLKEAVAEKQDVLGQFNHSEKKSWVGVDDINRHPFFAKQRRVVLKQCGKINPESIEEYIVHGGYTGLKKVLDS